MDQIPNVTGLPLESVQTILNDMNIQISVEETCSPKHKETAGECRVIKQVNNDNHVTLTVSYF